MPKATLNEDGKYEVTVTIKATIHPGLIGADLDEADVRKEVFENLTTGSYLVESAELVD